MSLAIKQHSTKVTETKKKYPITIPLIAATLLFSCIFQCLEKIKTVFLLKVIFYVDLQRNIFKGPWVRETLGCSTFFISINVLFDSDYVRQ